MDNKATKVLNEQQNKKRLFLLILFYVVIAMVVYSQIPPQKSKSGYTIETEGFVDLGLPSGTLWAACNIGASRPEEFGGYYAWGEVLVKSDYYWDNYFDTKNYVFQNNQYIINGNEKGKDDFKLYYPEGGRTSIKGDILHDVATLKFGSRCHIPSLEEFKELYDESSMIPDEYKGVFGFVVEGPNRKAIFFPAAGGRIGEDPVKQENAGRYWLSDLHTFFPDQARCFIFDDKSLNLNLDYIYRCVGYSVRPVMGKGD